MTRPNGHATGTAGIAPEPAVIATITGAEEIPGQKPGEAELATRTKQRARQQIQQNRFVIVGAGAIVLALMIFVFTSMPRKASVTKSKTATPTAQPPTATDAAPAEKSLFPIIDSGRPTAKAGHDGYLNEQDLQKTATRQPAYDNASRTQSAAAGTLGSIPPFGEQQPWQAPPYQPGANMVSTAEPADLGKAEREAMDKSSLVYVHKATGPQVNSVNDVSSGSDQEIGLGLRIGTRLRARLESAASTAVRTPVLAVIEYNYERDGEIIVPAGSKAVGQIQEADRSGYVRIQFDSLLMPDGASVPIQAAATDLELRPLKGKVEGKNTGKNVLVRSLSGIGQAGAILVGHGNFNQPLSESDLLRERVSNNIGVASDEEISRMAITQRIVVTISADTPIYVVLEQTPKARPNSLPLGQQNTRTPDSTSTEELRQLLQLQRELNQSTSTQVAN